MVFKPKEATKQSNFAGYGGSPTLQVFYEAPKVQTRIQPQMLDDVKLNDPEKPQQVTRKVDYLKSQDILTPEIPKPNNVKREPAPYEKRDKQFWDDKDYSKEANKMYQDKEQFQQFSQQPEQRQGRRHIQVQDHSEEYQVGTKGWM